MKTSGFCTAAILALAAGFSFASCSDDDDNNNDGGGNGNGQTEAVNPSKVFTAGIPAKVGTMSIICDAAGRVTQIRDDDETINFTYSTGRAAESGDVVMRGEDFTMYISLNESGFASHCREVMSEGEIEEWWFDYNSEGQLSKLRRTEGNNEQTDITYADGNIVSVRMRDNDNEGSDITVDYGSQPIDNKGCIMLFDETFGIDMDEMRYAYYAGMLGTATKSLPASYSYTEHGFDYSDEGTETFTWVLNSENLPSSLTMHPSQQVINFRW